MNNHCKVSCNKCGGPSPIPIPDFIDWRKKGAVNAVMNQGHCGSCWAFSATASLEGSYFVKNGKLLNFSEQQLMDCSTKNNGCRGGWFE